MKHEETPPCWRKAKAWAEKQESGDAVAAYITVGFALLSLLGWWLA